MPRRPRVAPGGLLYHVLNRSAGRIRLFRTDKDFLAFQRVLTEAHQRHPVQILCYCIMSTHWHFVVLPKRDGDLTAFFRWLAHSHAMRWRVAHHTVGYGPLYQGRFKSFPIQADEHLLTVCRYVERNPLTAKAVARAQDWRWSSLWAREKGPVELRSILAEWPVQRPGDWVRQVNEPLTQKQVQRMQISLERSRPFGDDGWVGRTVHRLHLEHTVRPEGQPRQTAEEK